MDYDLSRLNWRSFEQLVQAIGSEVLGPGLVVFGDGPDGGREATINAHLPYPTSSDGWSGLTLMQAKFLQKPKNTTSDGEWALNAFSEELSAYDGDNARTLPDNYIFASNVTLSAVAEDGAKDKMFSLATDAGLAHFDVWDYDKIRVYLDKSKELRRSYGPYVLSGDVLSQMVDLIETLAEARPDFDEVMSRFLQKELLADQWVNLEQAGRSAEEQVPVSRVFVDLPVSDDRQSDPPSETFGELSPGFVSQVLETAGIRLDPRSLNPQQHRKDDGDEGRPTSEARIVLVGGPGQGKTTVGQFVCQMFRASLLESRRPQSLAPEVRSALRTLKQHCQSDGLELPTVRRFPIRIELTKFADALGEAGGPKSLLAYIAQLVSDRTDEDISPSLMGKWLTSYSWLLILDGLDEVPASSNRAQLMDAIREFWVDLAGGMADCLVIATTRPQGYQDEFSPSYYRHLYLTPLSTARALHYAERLLNVRFANDADRRSDISGRLARAADRIDTGRLMTSPLQVTIMATLLERMGQPPEGRWNLFSQYYRVIYDRELEREIPAARVLRDHRPDIDAIHKRVGLLLQSEAENTSQAEAQISHERFAAVVEARLKEEELDDDAALVQQIIDAAMDRLVFLVPVEAEHIGFEIRSLQEFMAAEALLDGREKIVERRLRQIAPLSAWRNVFLFAAGRCFTELQHYRDTVYTICGELNDGEADPLAPLVLPGSALAVDLLEDGVANRQTKYQRLLSREALRVSRRPPSDLADRLAEIYVDSLRPTYEEVLREAVAQAEFLDALGAWRTLAVLRARGEGWAGEILQSHQPSSDDLGHLLEALPTMARSGWLADMLAKACATSSPSQTLPYHKELERLGVVQVSPAWFQAFAELTSRRLAESSPTQLKVYNDPDDDVTVGIRSVQSPSGPLEQALEEVELNQRKAAPASWEPLFGGIEFLGHPSRESLAQAVEGLQRLSDASELDAYGNYTAWPLAGIFLSVGVNGLGHVSQLADAARDGQFGDLDDWVGAETRWEDHGVGEKDLQEPDSEIMPFDRMIKERGFPLDTATITVAGSRREHASAVLEWLKLVKPKGVRRFVTSVLFWVLEGFFEDGVAVDLKFEDVANAVDIGALPERMALPLRALSAFQWTYPLSAVEEELLEVLGLRCAFAATGRTMPSELLGVVAKVISVQGVKPGLVRLLAIGSPMSEPLILPVFDQLIPMEASDDLASARALIALKLEQMPVRTSDLSALANEEDAWVVGAVEAIRQMAKSDARTWAFSQLAEAMPAKRWKLRRDLFGAGAAVISDESSGLASRESWDELELFDRAAA